MASDLAETQEVDHWQTLVADPLIDAGILCVADEESLSAAEQLALRGKGLVIDGHCQLPSSLVAELGLLDAEAAASIVPVFEWRAWPIHRQIRELLDTNALGALSTIRIERVLPFSPVDARHRLINEESMHSCLLQDVDLLRWFGGDYSQVTMLRTGVTERGFTGQTLSLGGKGLPDATCVYRSGPELDWTCELQGSEHTAIVRTQGNGLDLLVDGKEVIAQAGRTPDPKGCLRQIDAGLTRAPGSARWQDLVRIYEIEDAMQRSLKRRRTIDLHFETTSERSQFKTQMATVGCFVLVYTLFASVFLLLAGAILDPRDQIQRHAQAADFVLTADLFDLAETGLTEAGEQRVEDIASRWETTGAVVIVEGTDESEDAPPADQLRLERVREALREEGVQRVEERTVVRELTGQTFQTLVTLGRVVAFGPLGLFLLLQIFLLAARPGAAPGPAPAKTSGGTSRRGSADGGP